MVSTSESLMLDHISGGNNPLKISSVILEWNGQINLYGEAIVVSVARVGKIKFCVHNVFKLLSSVLAISRSDSWESLRYSDTGTT